MESIEKSIQVSDESMGYFLSKKYPQEIKSIETFEPEEISIDEFSLVEIKQLFKDRLKDEDETMLANHSLAFLHSPIIEDNFGNDRDARIDFINKVSSEHGDYYHRFFTSNRFKLANIRGIVEICKLVHMFSKSLPDELFEFSEKIKSEIDPSAESGGYSAMTQNQKTDIIEMTAKLAKGIVTHYLDKCLDIKDEVEDIQDSDLGQDKLKKAA